jgi:hypothetical protein
LTRDKIPSIIARHVCCSNATLVEPPQDEGMGQGAIALNVEVYP